MGAPVLWVPLLFLLGDLFMITVYVLKGKKTIQGIKRYRKEPKVSISSDNRNFVGVFLN